MSEFIIDQGNDLKPPRLREEITRCRDCVYICHNEYKNGCEYLTCGFFDNRYAEVDPDGFCAWGERRDA